jgi:hypothetical protein
MKSDDYEDICFTEIVELFNRVHVLEKRVKSLLDEIDNIRPKMDYNPNYSPNSAKSSPNSVSSYANKKPIC